jgi:hypothetical protein
VGAGRASCRCQPLRGASREVSGTEGLISQTVRGYWVRRALSTAPVSVRGGCIPSSRSPERTVRFIPSCSRSSSEFLRSLSCPFPYRDQADCQGLFPLRDITGCVHSTRGFPSPRYVPSAGVLNLSTAFSASGSAGLFHPATASRTFARSGAYLICAAAASSSEASCPLAVIRRAALRNKFRSPRSGALGFEAFIRAELAPRKVGS